MMTMTAEKIEFAPTQAEKPAVQLLSAGQEHRLDGYREVSIAQRRSGEWQQLNNPDNGRQVWSNGSIVVSFPLATRVILLLAG